MQPGEFTTSPSCLEQGVSGGAPEGVLEDKSTGDKSTCGASFSTKHILSWLVNSTVWARSFFPVEILSSIPIREVVHPSKAVAHQSALARASGCHNPSLLAPWQELHRKATLCLVESVPGCFSIGTRARARLSKRDTLFSKAPSLPWRLNAMIKCCLWGWGEGPRDSGPF